MAAATSASHAPDVSTDSYLVVGLDTCFLKEDGEVHEVKVIEPIPSAALEAILKGIPTSYALAFGTTLGELLTGEMPQKPAEFPPEAQWCDEFAERAIAAARTYKSRPKTQSHIPVGTTRSGGGGAAGRGRGRGRARGGRGEGGGRQRRDT